jgi:hypothetical protein
MADLVMRKRPAQHAGELGLFIDSEVFEDEFRNIKQGTDLEVKATQPRSLPQMRLAWGLAGKIAKSGALGDADQRDVMNYLLLKSRHVRYVTTSFRGDIQETVAVPKSIRFASMDQTEFQRLMNRMIFIVTSEIIPDLPESELRAEIEKMSGVGMPESAPAKPKRRRATAEQRTARNIAAAEGKALAALPPPVSVVPPHDPDTGEVINDTPTGTFPGDMPLPAEREAAARVPLPKSVDEWKEYCKTWLDAASEDESMDDQAVMQRWNGERSLRNECGVTFDDRAKIFEYYEAILDLKKEHR